MIRRTEHASNKLKIKFIANKTVTQSDIVF